MPYCRIDTPKVCICWQNSVYAAQKLAFLRRESDATIALYYVTYTQKVFFRRNKRNIHKQRHLRVCDLICSLIGYGVFQTSHRMLLINKTSILPITQTQFHTNCDRHGAWRQCSSKFQPKIASYLSEKVVVIFRLSHSGMYGMQD